LQELTSSNVHGRHYVDSFRIREAKGREVWTGCVGHGLTRWATAFLAQKGFNFEDWPKEVRERIGALPPAVETLTWPRAARGRDLGGPADQG
jgi:seryl-tRNA synthetase